MPASWTAIVNPAAGRRGARRSVPRVCAALRASGLELEVHVSVDAPDIRDRAGAALAAGRGLVACGGDGTVRELAALAAPSGGVLGIVPTGSGNDFARSLGIPLGDVEAAVAVLGGGHEVAVDLGRASAADGTEAWFTTVANAGFDGEANRWANTVGWVGGSPLYVLAVLRTLVTYRPTRLVVTVDGERHDDHLWLVAIANTKTYAGGMKVAPDASLDDGRLDVCMVGAVSRGRFLRAFPSVYAGRHTHNAFVRMARGAEVTLAAPGAGEKAELWASGERVGPLPATLTVAPRALRVMVPGRRAT